MLIWIRRICFGLLIATIGISISYLIAEVGMKSHYNFGVMIWICIVVDIGILFFGNSLFERHDRVKLKLTKLQPIPKEAKSNHSNFNYYFIFGIVFLVIIYLILNYIFNLQGVENIQAYIIK